MEGVVILQYVHETLNIGTVDWHCEEKFVGSELEMAGVNITAISYIAHSYRTQHRAQLTKIDCGRASSAPALGPPARQTLSDAHGGCRVQEEQAHKKSPNGEPVDADTGHDVSTYYVS